MRQADRPVAMRVARGNALLAHEPVGFSLRSLHLPIGVGATERDGAYCRRALLEADQVRKRVSAAQAIARHTLQSPNISEETRGRFHVRHAELDALELHAMRVTSSIRHPGIS